MLLEYASTYRGKTVAFIGLGVSNLPILELLAQAGAICTVRDQKDLTQDERFASVTQRKDIRFICGEAYLQDATEDVFFLSPAVRPDLPELLEARARGAVITSEMQEFFTLCPCKIIGITGSDGKTTTTTLISLLLEASGYRVHLGGNIGKNLLSRLDDIRKEDIAVVELSSFQLFKMTRSPDIAVITNISPNHLNWHKDMSEYVAAKGNILAFQSANGVAVLNRDNSYTEAYAAQAHGEVRMISGNGRVDNGIRFDETGIYDGDTLLVKDADIRLVGRHNRYNLSQAICATKPFLTPDALQEVATTFAGVEHRIEPVREKDGVTYYNSSIDSSPSRTEACLNSFAQKVIVICGGQDKHVSYDSLGPLFQEKAKAVVLCGATSDTVASVLDGVGYTNYYRTYDYETAVRTAASLAEPGDCVVLSPAATSFDLFRNFEERGRVFKRIVMEL